MPDEIHDDEAESLRLPSNWHALVRSAVLNVIGIVRIAMLTGREALIKNGDTTDARIHQLESEVAMLREELRIIIARMRRVPSNRRPQYTGLERMAILQLRAMRGWNKSEASRHFLVSDDTIRDWLRRVDDDALVQTSTPVNRFPDVVRYAAGTDQALLSDARQGEDRREAGPGRHAHRQVAAFRTGRER